MTNSANLHTKHIDRCNPNIIQRCVLFGWPIFKVLLLDSSPSYFRTKEKTTENHLLHAPHIQIQSQFLLNFFSLSCDDSWLIARSLIHPSRFLFTWRLKRGLWWKKNVDFSMKSKSRKTNWKKERKDLETQQSTHARICVRDLVQLSRDVTNNDS